jgi:hypothetical protein
MGTTTYDKLSRGRKQEIDLKRREDLKKAKDMPDSRVSDTVVDIAGGVSRLVGGPAAGMARAGYEAGRKDRERKAQDKADYKDLKEKPTKLFRDKNVKGMSDDELSKVGDFKVEKNKTGGEVFKVEKNKIAKARSVVKSKATPLIVLAAQWLRQSSWR